MSPASDCFKWAQNRWQKYALEKEHKATASGGRDSSKHQEWRKTNAAVFKQKTKEKKKKI